MTEENKNKAWWQPAMIIFAKFSGWIVIPLLLGLFIGRWLDKKYGTEPWLFLTTAGVSFFISMGGLIFSVMKEFRKIERESKNKNGNNPNTN